jgi:glycosyltransferase involved in cell wall biosynthesis
MQSVFAQTYKSIEYIVIDGGSTDGSAALIEAQAAKLAYWVSEKDRGQTDAINKGLARATGKYMAWLNADDRLLPNAVSEAVEFLEANPDVGMVYGDANYIDADGRVVGNFPAAQTDYARLRRGYVHIPQQTSFWRAELWRQVAPLDASFVFAMDYDLWVRLAKISKLQYLPRLWRNSACTRIPRPSPTTRGPGTRCCACTGAKAAAGWRRSWPSIGCAAPWPRSSTPAGAAC